MLLKQAVTWASLSAQAERSSSNSARRLVSAVSAFSWAALRFSACSASWATRRSRSSASLLHSASLPRRAVLASPSCCCRAALASEERKRRKRHQSSGQDKGKKQPRRFGPTAQQSARTSGTTARGCASAPPRRKKKETYAGFRRDGPSAPPAPEPWSCRRSRGGCDNPTGEASDEISSRTIPR